jgi:hypothetical protein
VVKKYAKKQNRRKAWIYAGRTVAKPEPFGFYALIRLDISSVKKELLRKWKKAERDFEKQQQEWDAYCNEDRPAYEKWLHMTFGSRMTELRELHEQVRRKDWFIEQVECLSGMSGTSPRKLYQELQKKAAGGKSLHDALDEYIRELDDLDDEDIFDDDECDFADNDIDHNEPGSIFDKLFGKIFNGDGDLKEEFNKIFEEFKDISGGRKKVVKDNPETKNRQARIRDIYRKLCFKLHPDTGCDFNAENSRLWHHIQEAYQKNDLDRLLAIQASLDMKQDPMSSHISCAQILAVIDDFKNGLRSVRALVRNAQRESSWRFLAWSDKQRKAAMRQLEEQLAREQLSLKYEMECLESIEKKWSRITVKPKPQPKAQAKTKPQTKINKTQTQAYAPSSEQYARQMSFDF